MPSVVISNQSQIRPGRLHFLVKKGRQRKPTNVRHCLGITGQTERGPLTPQLIGSLQRFEEVYGRYTLATATVNKVWRVLADKPLFPCVVVRAVAAAATASTIDLVDGATVIARLTFTKGSWSTGAEAAVSAASDEEATHYKVTLTEPNGKVWIWDNINTQTATDDNTGTVQGDDAALPAVLTKIADGRPDDDSSIPLTTTGVDGSIADSDFTGTGGPMETLNSYVPLGYPGLLVRMVAERSNSAIDTKATTLASSATYGKWLITSAASTTSATATATDADSYRDERIAYCANYVTWVNPVSGLKEVLMPTVARACYAMSTDYWIHAGDARFADCLSWVVDLAFPSWATLPAGGGELDDLDDAGVTALYRDHDGFKFFNDRTTSLSGERSGAAVAIDDALIFKANARVAPYQNQPITEDLIEGIIGELEAVSEESFRAGTGVSWWVGDDGEVDRTKGGYQVEFASSDDDLQNEIARFAWAYRRMAHATAIAVEIERGRGVRFRRAA